MGLLHKIKRGIKFVLDPQYRFIFLSGKGVYDDFPDKKYLEKKFYAKLGYKLDLTDPKTFNEKLQWLKLYNRQEDYVKMVDKYEVKEYVASVIGEKYIIPTIKCWNSVDDIDWDELPDKFVLKVTHDSGGIVICKNKKYFDINKAIKQLKKSMKRNYFLLHREWPYRDVPKKIIAEEYMSENDKELTDYKFMCFNGICKCIFTGTGRYSKEGLKITFYDVKWNKLPFERHYPACEKAEKKPGKLDEMIILAEKLSKNIPFVRVDFYLINNQVFFGEITFYPGSGFEEFRPFKWDNILGSWIELPEVKNNEDNYWS